MRSSTLREQNVTLEGNIESNQYVSSNIDVGARIYGCMGNVAEYAYVI
jgi:hypothetical protein